MIRRIARAILWLLPRSTVVPVVSGTLRGSRWILHSGTHGCWAGTYERPVQRLFEQFVAKGDVVFDIGANVGFFTLLAAKLVGPTGRVFAFEPLPRNVEYIERHLALNRVENATVLPLALSRAAGVARFNIAESPSMGRLSESGTLEVETASLDELLRSGRIAAPAFIKMDVEGAECDVLNGAKEMLAEHRPAILLSAHGWQQHELCTAFLQTTGYKLELLRDGAADGDYLVLARFQT